MMPTSVTRGKSSPLGYFLDSYNYDAFRRFLVEPFRRGEDVVETARFDHKVDLPLIRRESVGPSAILIIDAPRGAVAGIEVAGDDDADGFHPARHVGDAAETAFRQEFIVVAPP
jgi:hypothetical protein